MKKIYILCLFVLFSQLFFGQSGNLEWVKATGNNGVKDSKSILTDAAGNVYVFGNFTGTYDFDPGPAENNLISSGYNMYIQKLDASGNFIWAKQFGEGGSVNFLNAVIKSNGTFLCTGSFFGNADFDPGPGMQNLASPQANAGFIVKLDADAELVWAKQTSSADGTCQGNVINADTAGNIYLTGPFSYTVDFDPGPGVATLTATDTLYQDMFIVKLDSSGNFNWVKQVPLATGLDWTSPAGIATTDASAVYISGYFLSSVDFDPGPDQTILTSQGNVNAFILKLNSNGDFIWAKAFTGPGDIGVRSLLVDGSGYVYTAGYFTATSDFDPGPANYPLTFTGVVNFYICKLDPNGNFVWAKAINSSSYTESFAMVLDAYANIYCAGYFYDATDFDPGTGTYILNSPDSANTFVAKYSNAGNFLSAKQFAGGFSSATGITLNEQLEIFTIGYFRETVDFDPGPNTLPITGTALFNNLYVHKMNQAEGGPVPVNFVSASAVRSQNSVTVEWNISEQTRIVNYYVERSLDGNHFSAIGSVPVLSNNTGILPYHFKDVNAPLTDLFYRIRSMGIDGQKKYSNIVRVAAPGNVSMYTVVPNPVQNGLVNLVFNNQPTGLYKVSIMASNGQLILNQTINHHTNSNLYQLKLPNSIQSGYYRLCILTEDKRTIIKTILVQ